MKLPFSDWIAKIDENFEKEFWIDQSGSSQYINRRQIYKDTVNSSFGWTDYQLRPNFLVAAVVVSSSLLDNHHSHSLSIPKAPEMFNKTHIWAALKQVETILVGKYGVKTLDPRFVCSSPLCLCLSFSVLQ